MAYHLDAPRCQHLRDSGMRCGSPALRGQSFCYHHQLLRQPRIAPGQPGFKLPALESHSSIQLFVRQVLQSFHDGALNAAQARLYLYGIQLVAPYCSSDSVISSEIATELPAAMETQALSLPSPLQPVPSSEAAQPPLPRNDRPVARPEDHRTQTAAAESERKVPPSETSRCAPPSPTALSLPPADGALPARPPRSALLSPEEHAEIVAILKQQPDGPEKRNAVQRLLAHNREVQRLRAG